MSRSRDEGLYLRGSVDRDQLDSETAKDVFLVITQFLVQNQQVPRMLIEWRYQLLGPYSVRFDSIPPLVRMTLDSLDDLGKIFPRPCLIAPLEGPPTANGKGLPLE